MNECFVCAACAKCPYPASLEYDEWKMECEDCYKNSGECKDCLFENTEFCPENGL